MTLTRLSLLAATSIFGMSCLGPDDVDKTEEDELPTPMEYVAKFEDKVLPTWTAWQTSEWEAHTHVRNNDPRYAEQAAADRQAFLDIAGNPQWIRLGRDVLREAVARAKVDPATLPEGTEPPAPPSAAEQAAIGAVSVFARRYSKASAELRANIDQKYTFLMRFRARSTPKLAGSPISADELSGILRASESSEERQEAWEALLAPAGAFKPGYAELRDLRNMAARKAGWENHLEAMVHPYKQSVPEVAKVLSASEQSLRPFFRELHTWTRHALAEQFQQPVPDRIPVHWLDDPLGATWTSALDLESIDITEALEDRGAETMVQDVERFFTDAGLPGLSESYWANSSLYPAEEGARFGKTGGASTWNIDAKTDVRSLMSIEANAPSWHAAHREFSFAHAYELRNQSETVLSPVRVEPPHALLAALATWSDLAASKPARLDALGLLPEDDEVDTSESEEETLLLAEALTWVPYVHYAGAVFDFERAVYVNGLSTDRMTSRWWELADRHQGVVPPARRIERWGDPLQNPQLIDAPGRYIDHALATLIAFQLHVTLCEQLDLDPRTADLSGRPEFGEWFTRVANSAGVRNWQTVIEKITGEPLSAAPMVRYFEPLNPWLVEANDGRRHTMSK